MSNCSVRKAHVVLSDDEHSPQDPLTRYRREARRYPLLTAQEEQTLGDRALGGDRSARNKIVCHNLRLVMMFAARYAYRGLPMDDLVQAGNEGLIEAATRFDHRKHGTRFATYAEHWIRKMIREALDQNRGIAIPEDVLETRARLRKAKARFYAEHGYIPKENILFQALGLPKKQMGALRRFDTVLVSLDQTEGTPLRDSLVNQSPDLLSTFEYQRLAKCFLIKLHFDKNLAPEQRTRMIEVVIRHCGLNGQDPMTHGEIARELGYTETLVKKIWASALVRMRKFKINIAPDGMP